jgi:glycine/D-amino acid oxidase-like deaminating enzyme/nitrite reductase/ring-hydroxylating ferredoxin subunit
MYRDGARKSLWQQEVKKFDLPGLADSYDVAIVGGGITGYSCAIQLQEAGKRCIVIEASNTGFGTTGGTTAHINTFFDASYDQVINDFGEENAKKLAQAGKDALEIIKSNIDKYQIQCEFDERVGYLFSLNEEQEKTLEKIWMASNEVGVAMEYTTDCPFPIPHTRAVSIPGQGQFHPLKYIDGLASAFNSKGGHIADDCRVTDVDPSDTHLIINTTSGLIIAQHVIYATHTPPGVNILHFRNAPYRSYALAVKLNGAYPQALGYDLSDPYHYYRTQTVDGEAFLIAGGEDHKTGHEEDTGIRFTNLENYVRQHFDVDTIAYSWSSQYYESADGLPYIGHLPGADERIFVATGYTGNGMTFGTIAGKVLSDLITRKENAYEDLFKPSRVKPVAGFSSFVKEGADVVASFVKDKVFTDHLKSLADLKDGEARTVKYDGAIYAMYKDERGRIHAVNSACPHVNCNVHWNGAEKTWDCPCHGSRFNLNGRVLNAPAVKDLERINFLEDESDESDESL